MSLGPWYCSNCGETKTKDEVQMEETKVKIYHKTTKIVNKPHCDSCGNKVREL